MCASPVDPPLGPAYYEWKRAKLKEDPRYGTEHGCWHIYKPGAGGGYCGCSMAGSHFGFICEWPDPQSPLIDFYCRECLSHRPVHQPSLFGD